MVSPERMAQRLAPSRGCRADKQDFVVGRFEAMREALNLTGRPILFAICEWGVADPWLWAPKVRVKDVLEKLYGRVQRNHDHGESTHCGTPRAITFGKKMRTVHEDCMLILPCVCVSGMSLLQGAPIGRAPAVLGK